MEVEAARAPPKNRRRLNEGEEASRFMVSVGEVNERNQFLGGMLTPDMDETTRSQEVFHPNTAKSTS